MIDWAFIGSLEGQSVLDGYVPDPNGSQSGVTVATGVDLGQMDKEALRALELPIALARKLAPYVGLKGATATMALASMPLSLTPDEAATLDGAARYPDTHGLIERYGEAAPSSVAASSGVRDSGIDASTIVAMAPLRPT